MEAAWRAARASVEGRTEARGAAAVWHADDLGDRREAGLAERDRR